jgi:hypothetical protein
MRLQPPSHTVAGAALLTRLCRAEQQLLRSLGAGSFEQLRLAQPSMLGFCAAHSADLDPLLGTGYSGDGGGGGLQAASLKLAGALLTVAPAASADDLLLEAALSAHFAANSLRELGWRDAAEVRARLRDGRAAAAACTLQAAGRSRPCQAVALWLSGAPAAPPPSGALGPMTAADARAAVAAHAPLADVAVATCWRLVFQASLGPLADFVAATADLPLLEVGHGAFVRISAGGSLQQFDAATRGLWPKAAVALALGLCAEAGGLGLAPLQLMRSKVEAMASDTPTAAAARFVLRCAALMPAPLRTALAATVFLDGFAKVTAEPWASLLAAADGGERSALHAVACERRSLPAVMDDLAAALVPEEAAVTEPSAEIEPSAGVAPPEPVPQRAPESGMPMALAPPDSSTSAAAGGGPTGEATCQEVCATIAVKYGGNLQLAEADSATRRAMEELRAMSARAIRLLSTELCALEAMLEPLRPHARASRSRHASPHSPADAGSAHFVLELVQNADDNACAPTAMHTCRSAFSSGASPSPCTCVALSSSTPNGPPARLMRRRRGRRARVAHLDQRVRGPLRQQRGGLQRGKRQGAVQREQVDKERSAPPHPPPALCTIASGRARKRAFLRPPWQSRMRATLATRGLGGRASSE